MTFWVTAFHLFGISCLLLSCLYLKNSYKKLYTIPHIPKKKRNLVRIPTNTHKFSHVNILQNPRHTSSHNVKQYIILSLKTNPYQEIFWLYLAILEKKNQNIKNTIFYLLKGIENCPESNILWYTLLKTHRFRTSFKLKTLALKRVKEPLGLWPIILKYCNLRQQKIILYWYLKNYPKFLNAWTELLSREPTNHIKPLLLRAVECCPSEINFWTALANFGNYSFSKKIINIARFYNPGNLKIWIYASKLEESYGNYRNIPMIFKRYFVNIFKTQPNIKASEILKTISMIMKDTVIFPRTYKYLINCIVIYGLVDGLFFTHFTRFIKKEQNNTSFFIIEHFFKMLIQIFKSSQFLKIVYLKFLFTNNLSEHAIQQLFVFMISERNHEIFHILSTKVIKSLLPVHKQKNFLQNLVIFFLKYINLQNIILFQKINYGKINEFFNHTKFMKKITNTTKDQSTIQLIKIFVNFKCLSDVLFLLDDALDEKLSYDDREPNRQIFYILSSISYLYDSFIYTSMIHRIIIYKYHSPNLFSNTAHFMIVRKIHPSSGFLKIVMLNVKKMNYSKKNSLKNTFFYIYKYCFGRDNLHTLLIEILKKNPYREVAWLQLINLNHKIPMKYIILFSFKACVHSYEIIKFLSTFYYRKQKYSISRSWLLKTINLIQIDVSLFLRLIYLEFYAKNIHNYKFLTYFTKLSRKIVKRHDWLFSYSPYYTKTTLYEIIYITKLLLNN